MSLRPADKLSYPNGGAELYFLDLVDLLPEAGHAVAPFSMRHAQNQATPFARHFVSPVDYERASGWRAVQAVGRTVYNRETVRRVRDLVQEFRPDVAHLHNVHHQLSGSLFEALGEARVPVVQTLHDFQWVCPVYTFTRNGRVCEECHHGRVLPAVRHRCHSGSLARSLVAALELQVGVWRGWERRVSLFLAPSRFLGETVVRHGLPKAKVRRFGYCLRLDGYRRTAPRERHALYAGRLSAEKGIETLLRALADVPDLHLRIAGGGPLEPALRRLAAAVAPGRVRFLGHLDAASLRDELCRAAFVVVPSEWYENQPYAVLEAFAMETPVVGADIGGIPELVVEGETGALFESGSSRSLTEALMRLASGDVASLGRAARARVEQEFDPARHIQDLCALYAEAAA